MRPPLPQAKRWKMWRTNVKNYPLLHPSTWKCFTDPDSPGGVWLTLPFQQMDNWWVIYKWHSHGWLECQGSLSEVMAGGTRGLCPFAELLWSMEQKCLGRHITRGVFLASFTVLARTGFFTARTETCWAETSQLLYADLPTLWHPPAGKCLLCCILSLPSPAFSTSFLAYNLSFLQGIALLQLLLFSGAQNSLLLFVFAFLSGALLRLQGLLWNPAVFMN